MSPGNNYSVFDRVSVVVLCYNRADEVSINIPPRIQDVKDYGMELIVVDNHSNDGTRELLEKYYDEDQCFTLVMNDSNLGVGAGRNSGWEKCTREIVITIDEDTRITSEQLCKLAEELLQSNRIGILTPVMYDLKTNRLISTILEAPFLVTNFLGACYAVRMEVIRDAGYHDPNCDFGGEELDLSIRARNAGWEVVQLASMRVAHNGRQREANDVVPIMRRLPWTRNHARVIWRHFPYHHALSWSLIILAQQLKYCLRNFRWLEVPKIVVAWSSGVKEGIQLHSRVRNSVTKFYKDRLGVLYYIRRLMVSKQ